MSFDQLGLSAEMLRAVQAEGYSIATPIQHQAIPAVLAGNDVMGCAQTGTGKTAAFALPTLQRLAEAHASATGGRPNKHGKHPRKIRSLVLSPTRELAAQIGASFAVYGRFSGMRHTVVYGGVSQNPQVRALRAGVDILVATPGRLLDLMQQRHINLSAVDVLILDEADQMLDMGFLPPLRKIVASVPQNRQTLMFSATMPPEIRRLASEWLREPVHVQVAPVAAPAELVEQSVVFVEPKQKAALLTQFLRSTPSSRTLVFSRTKHGADKIVRSLTRSGIRAEAIHGNKSQSVRQRALEKFKSDRPPVLVATDIASRGLDIDGVSHVINYDLPEVPESYVHRIGRTGRAGADGVAVSFCGREERSRLRSIEKLTRRKIRIEEKFADFIEADSPPASDTADKKPHGDGPYKKYPRRKKGGKPFRPGKFGAKSSSSTGNSDNSGGKPSGTSNGKKFGKPGKKKFAKAGAKPAAPGARTGKPKRKRRAPATTS
ncbi:MAG: DEAD/DEAH box helicase [Pirellulaceae bacterium]